MTEYPHDTIVPFSDSDKGKKEQVADMFNKIAFRYDLVNSALSGGIDRYWRRKAIRQLARATPHNILDVATGTAEMAILTVRTLSQPSKASGGGVLHTRTGPWAQITGVDISEGMLEIGRQKVARLNLDKQITLQTGDSEALPFPDNQFDAITVAFGVRNFGNLEKGLTEMLRVLRPGGRLVVLEFSRPASPAFRLLYEGYMRLIASPLGRILSRNRCAYQYLRESVQAFPEGQQFLDILVRAGYVETRMKPLTFGICTIYEGAKILL
ncbi:MAG: bifunctional demethylmenaquinone methyltransferase/2-methoxy-6-polyprenyl-1,4-benzoquinol methylase UbiE [Bacteroidota bacterium]|nr:bifunctional demethylmenaquinone methyltransferase/2-methoxy-6-polyprenyl-1,4-benzoquinol methylase UbiE [Bacteroidota bacterium]MDP4218503.1 bifunctional demethylmenaquinone methyltransferase/2-methoxy-6-polyprenyl-1,4-benzoquinol methylase UbiE [Bacteroidota bacterium]MDP4245841.1 bifunctional demethylmenaquinone methyltransferase/2-methoxy-6-polyprenyl-1,4-benzoquinol methylase UbiE [Bacteroidota bacterium]MDP4252661.1 bifunctional demethylmenaquinone methyltransferase/2-methoxy-6-polypren